MHPYQFVFALCLPCASLFAQTDAEVLRRLEQLQVSTQASEARAWLLKRGSDIVPIVVMELDRGGVRASRAISALRVLGPESVGCLSKLVEFVHREEAADPLHQEWDLALAVVYAIGEIGRHLDADARREIKTTLGSRLKPRGVRRGLPSRFFQSHRYMQWVGSALRLGIDATDAELITDIAGKETSNVHAAIELVRFRGRASDELLELLVAAIGATPLKGEGSVDDPLRIDAAAARTLIRCAPRHARVELAHARLLQFGTAEERRIAAIYLGSLGPQSSVYLRPLLATMKDSDVEVARAAIVAVGACGVPDPSEELSRSQLRKMLHDKDPVVVHRAVRDLSWSGPVERDAIPLLRTLSQHSHPRVAAAAAATLATLTR